MNWTMGLMLSGLTGCIIVEDTTKTDTGTTTTTETTQTTVTSVTTTTTTTIPDPDDDGDGFPASIDCDDTDAAINPDADEICDLIDNNCDLGIDDEFAVTIAGVNFATVDDALAAAVAGDQLDICAGTWTMTSATIGAAQGSITLYGVSGRDNTTLSEVANDTLAMVTTGGTLNLDGVTVSGSTAEALQVDRTGTLNVTDARISGNGQGINLDGAGLNGVKAAIAITATDIEANVNANGDGGGIGGIGLVDLSITDSNITGNSAVNGGGIYLEVGFIPSTITLTSTSIDTNTADVGGGIAIKNVILSGDSVSTVMGNTAGSDGGGLALYRSMVSGLLVSGNMAVNGGGVAALRDLGFANGPLLNPLASVIIDGNTADNGGGIFVANLEACSVDAYSAVTVNVANDTGGGAYLEGNDEETMFTSEADFGAAAVNDNAPDDIYTSADVYTVEGAQPVTCDGANGCAIGS